MKWFLIYMAVGLVIFFLLHAPVLLLIPIAIILILVITPGLIGIIVGLYRTVVNYLRSIKEKKEPYEEYIDKGKRKQPARRNYFFGPGYRQLYSIVSTACKYINDEANDLDSKPPSKSKFVRFVTSIFYVTEAFTIVSLGNLFWIMMAVAHGIIFLAIASVIYVVFSIAWLSDRIYLLGLMKNKL